MFAQSSETYYVQETILPFSCYFTLKLCQQYLIVRQFEYFYFSDLNEAIM